MAKSKIEELESKIEDVLKDVKSSRKLKPVNLEGDLEDEFLAAYQNVISDYLRFKFYMNEQKSEYEKNKKEFDAISHLIDFVEPRDVISDEELITSLENLFKHLRDTVSSFDSNKAETETMFSDYEARVKRGEAFVKELSNDIKILKDENGKEKTDEDGSVLCEVGDKALFLTEFLHSVSSITEETEEDKQKQVKQ